MPTTKPRYTIIVDKTMLDWIDDFWHDHRYPNRSAATVDLIKIGMKALEEHGPDYIADLAASPKNRKADAHRDDRPLIRENGTVDLSIRPGELRDNERVTITPDELDDEQYRNAE